MGKWSLCLHTYIHTSHPYPISKNYAIHNFRLRLVLLWLTHAQHTPGCTLRTALVFEAFQSESFTLHFEFGRLPAPVSPLLENFLPFRIDTCTCPKSVCFRRPQLKLMSVMLLLLLLRIIVGGWWQPPQRIRSSLLVSLHHFNGNKSRAALEVFKNAYEFQPCSDF